MRCATVGGFTRNALPISSVVRPHTSRSVSATCASSVSAGWQHVKISRRRSSSTGCRRMPVREGVGWRPAVEPFGELCQRRVEARAPAHGVDRLEAAGRDEPRARVVGQPLARPLLDGRRKRVVHRLFGAIEIAEQADQRRQHAPRVGAVDGIHHLPRALARKVIHGYSTATTPRRNVLLKSIVASWRRRGETCLN